MFLFINIQPVPQEMLIAIVILRDLANMSA